MKKALIILTAVLAVTVSVAASAAARSLGMYTYIVLFHKAVISGAEYSEYSETNGDFTIRTRPVESKRISFTVENKDGECVWSCPDSWRLYDFKGVHFTDGNDIEAVSGDVGISQYKYRAKDGADVWIKRG